MSCGLGRNAEDRTAAALATAGTALADLVARAATSWIDVRERLFPGDEALNPYDTLAVAAAVDSERFTERVTDCL